MDCPQCGTKIPQGEARCPECQATLVGDPMNAPAGSDPTLPDQRHRAPWNAAVWGIVATVVVLATVLAIVAL